jgi:hypothetical protein
MNFNFNFRKQDKISFAEELRKSFSVAINIFKKDFLIIILIYVLVYLPMDSCYLFANNTSSDQINYLFKIILSADFFRLILYFIPSLIFGPLGTASLSSVVSQYLAREKSKEENKKEKISIEKIIDCSLIKWHRLIIANFSYYAIIMFSFPFFIFPAIFFAVYFYFCITIISLTQKISTFPAMLLSMFNLQGKFFKTLIIMTAIFVINSLLNYSLFQIVKNTLNINIFLYIFCFILSIFLSRLVEMFLKIILINYFLNYACLMIPEINKKF